MRYYMVMQYVSRVGNAMTCHRTGYDRCDIQMLAIQMCGLFSCVVDVDIYFFSLPYLFRFRFGHRLFHVVFFFRVLSMLPPRFWFLLRLV